MNKNTPILLMLIFLSAFCIKAQNTTFEWAISVGGTQSDYCLSSTIDTFGNTYTTGYFFGTVDFDPGVGVINFTSDLGLTDIFVQKFDSLGNLLWVHSFGSYQWDLGRAITTDIAGNVYITGHFQLTADFDPGSGVFNLSGGVGNTFILKLDALGNFVWAKSIEGGNNDSYSIITDAQNNIYLTGIFGDSIDADPGTGVAKLISTGSTDIYILKLDSTGNFVWAKSIGGGGNKKCHSIAVDGLGCVYLTGEFENTVDFNPDTGITYLSSHGQTDVFVEKLDASGNFMWANSFGSNNLDAGKSLALDANANVYITGYFKNYVQIDTGNGYLLLSSNGNEDIFVEKIDSSGNYQWIKTMGGINSDYGQSIVVDAIGNIYITGSFQYTVDFDPDTGVTNLISLGGKDIFVQKLNTNGGLDWVESIGGTGSEECTSISIDALYNIYMSGSLMGSTDFDPGVGVTNLTSNGSYDFFVAKFSLCIPSTSSLTISACKSYTWLINNTTYFSSGIYSANLTNSAGCDSVITMNLTINNVDTSITQTGITLNASTSGASYQWLDCNNGYAIIAGATNQSFTPTSNGNYAVEISKYGCVDTSVCYSITGIGISENNFRSSFNFYPNPISGKVTIDLEKTYKEIDIKVRNLLGQTVLSKTYKTTNQLSFEIKGAKGIYFVEIRTANGKSAVLKVVKE